MKETLTPNHELFTLRPSPYALLSGPPQPGEKDLPPVTPDVPVVPDPSQPEPLPLPPDAERTPPAPVREPDNPPPAGDPPKSEPTRLA